jgi:hypothetical protein
MLPPVQVSGSFRHACIYEANSMELSPYEATSRSSTQKFPNHFTSQKSCAHNKAPDVTSSHNLRLCQIGSNIILQPTSKSSYRRLSFWLCRQNHVHFLCMTKGIKPELRAVHRTALLQAARNVRQKAVKWGNTRWIHGQAEPSKSCKI